MSDALIALPTDILTDSGTVSLTAGSADSVYPLTNCYDRVSWTVFKSTGTTCTIHVVFGSAKTLQGFAFINCNATAIQITNGAGFNQAVTIPATPEDGLRLDPWLDARTLPNTSSTTWDFAFTAASTVGLGELVLAQSLRTIQITWSDASFSEVHLTSRDVTDYGVRLAYGMGVRNRSKSGHVKRQTEEAGVLSLARSARGGLKPFLLIWNSSVNDSLWVQLESDEHIFNTTYSTISDVAVSFIEQQKGLAL